MITKFKLFEEDGGGFASSTLGNTGGMGDIVAPIVSSVPGLVSSSIAGSGDLPAISGAYYAKSTNYDFINKYNKKKKRKKSKIKKFSDFK